MTDKNFFFKENLKKLEESAKNLNACSDSLGEIVIEINTILKKLNLGISTWIVQSEGGTLQEEKWKRSFGYARIGGKWGLSIKYEIFNENRERVSIEEWPFNEAPRYMRIEVIGKLPDLIEEMVVRTNEIASKITNKTKEAVTYLQQLKSN